MKWKALEKPKRLDYDRDTLSATYGKFYAEPFERGYAITIGNSLRRILLSSIQAAAVTSVRIEGVLHEFSSIPGVAEDSTDIILNLKQLKLKMEGEGPKTIRLSVSGDKEVTARDIKTDATIEIVNPDLHIATLTERDAKLELEMEVDMGRGYVSSDKNKRDDMPVGTIPMDSLFSPVTRVRIDAENTRVGQMTDYDRLVMEIWTDGRMKPEDALAHSAKLLKDHLQIFINFEEEPEEAAGQADDEKGKMRDLLSRSVDELELSVRSSNCLKNANIKTIGDLVTKSEAEMLKYRNFGRKSLNEIKEIITEMGLELGMSSESLSASAEPELAARGKKK
ncbi:MAG: DNA-directed RNA polymerase subunit alpha [candidate division FCPU426 bacterium]